MVDPVITQKGPEDKFSEYQCPVCGFWGDESSLVSQTPAVYNYGKALEFGGTPLDWEETHECPNDGTVFVFDNSNC